MGRVVTETDALGGVVSYEYNAFNEVTKVTDARGFFSTKTYDRLGRLITTTDALNNVTTNGYNVFGDLLTVTRGTATTSFDYDRLGRVVKTTDAEGHYEQYTLDAFGNRSHRPQQARRDRDQQLRPARPAHRRDPADVVGEFGRNDRLDRRHQQVRI